MKKNHFLVIFLSSYGFFIIFTIFKISNKSFFILINKIFSFFILIIMGIFFIYFNKIYEKTIGEINKFSNPFTLYLKIFSLIAFLFIAMDFDLLFFNFFKDKQLNLNNNNKLLNLLSFYYNLKFFINSYIIFLFLRILFLYILFNPLLEIWIFSEKYKKKSSYKNLYILFFLFIVGVILNIFLNIHFYL